MMRTTADLVRAAAIGDRTAFEILVGQHAALVTGVAYSKCGDFALCEDIAQEAFIEAWKNLKSILEPEKFSSWICVIARRRAVDAMRSAKSSRAHSSLEEMKCEIEDDKQPTPEVHMTQRQERELVWSLLAQLPEAYREPMILFYRCEESTRDVAMALGESEATIRQRLKRGRDMLRTEMTETIRTALGATVPKAAFTMMVMASLPSVSYAAGIAGATATAGKSSSALGATATSALSGAAVGTLVGIAGGVFGTWMSWKNCEYQSQQKFILRQAFTLFAGLIVFSILLAILVRVRLQGMIPDDTVYATLLIGLILGSQGLSALWAWRVIRGYKQIAKEAKLGGEPMRRSAEQRIDRVREQTRVIHTDGSATYEAFRWNAAGWFGSGLGASAWMLPLGFSAFWFGSFSLGILTVVSFLTEVALALVLWRLRNRIDAYVALQVLLGLTFVVTTSVFVGIELLATAETRRLLQWSPWAWCALLLFPLLSLQFWSTRRTFDRNMQEYDR